MLLLVLILILLLVYVTSASSSILGRVNENYHDAIQSAGYRFAIPEKRIAAIIAVESAGDSQAQGTSEERGLMQIKAIALQDVNEHYGYFYSFNDLWNPTTNVLVGTAYLNLKRAEWNDLDKGTRAYNVGTARLQRDPSAGLVYLYKIKAYEAISP